ncbi:T9SS type B sorting domain-containing protein [Flavobacterium supellecticarium]|uniref:T9SS type B sorting domain-containing protein n=2 Tax=Flavobacterium supellecticarium TaxID=2565924 RepID=A0A4S3ZQ97_9FLAO|nr:T9SS type B sorting domain-containing protein [Flavobacterium supellecticarium]
MDRIFVLPHQIKYLMMKKTFLMLLMIMLNSICLSQVFPEGFEGSFPPSGPEGAWIVTHNGIGMGPMNRNIWKQTPLITSVYNPHSGNYAAMVEKINIGDGKTEEDWLIAPKVAIPAGGELSFYILHGRAGDQGSKLKIKISKTSQTDLSSFTEVAEFSESQIGSVPGVYNKMTLTFNEQQVTADEMVYIAFVRVHEQTEGGTGDRFLIDDIELKSPCVTPTDIKITNVTANSAVLAWALPDSPGKWEIELIAAASPRSESTTVTQNQYAVINLDPQTTYRFRVRSECGEMAYSEWSDFYAFTTLVNNDECRNAQTIPVNEDQSCNKVVPVSFLGTTITGSDSCVPDNNGDIWFSFTATHETHMIDLINFKGNAKPVAITMYEGKQCDQTQPIYCNTTNSLLALGLRIGTVYTLRLAVSSPRGKTAFSFDLCVKIPDVVQNNATDCLVYTVNPDFEKPLHQVKSAYPQLYNQHSVPGWKTTAENNHIKFWHSGNNRNIQAYSGTQFVEINETEGSDIYQDYATAVPISFRCRFVHRGRDNESSCALYAGPPEGPFALVVIATTGNNVWKEYVGTYAVPENQPVTRFIFKNQSGSGNLLDDFELKGDNSIVTPGPLLLNCANALANVSAKGEGVWMADTNNPGTSTIGDYHANKTTISGFTTSGTYRYYWKTAHCVDILDVKIDNEDKTTLLTFNPIGPICPGAAVPKLPSRSKEGIAGAWMPPVISNAITTTYVFTPYANQCVKQGITASLTVAVQPIAVTVLSDCINDEVVLKIQPEEGNTFDLTKTHFQWFCDKKGNVGKNMPDFNVTRYCRDWINDVAFPIVFTVKVTAAGSCSVTKEIAVEGLRCQIQKGISPNSDNLNDTFDLTGFSVEKLSIFNRYGTEVYSHGAGYTNQWFGQSKNGGELPDSTYFYVIDLKKGETKTGWVYISRENR